MVQEAVVAAGEQPDQLVQVEPAGRSSRPVWWMELLLVLGGYGIYHEAQIHSPTTAALRHGWDIIQAERWAHISIDGTLNRTFASTSLLAVPAEYYYATLHFAVTIGVLVWLWTRHPASYREARRVIVGGTLMALGVFWTFPAAPPRMFPQAGFIDTGLRYRIPLDIEAGKASHAADLYAAMPSLHIGWSLWVAWAVTRVVPNRSARRLVWAYPALTALVVMGTGNHSALDLVGGALVMLAGAGVTVWLPQQVRRLDWRRALVPVAAAAGPLAVAGALVSEPHLVDGAFDAMLKARPVWLIAALGAEIASMSAFSRLQVRTLRMTGYDIRRRTALAINYASNAISATIPIVGSAAGTANTWRQYQRRGASPAAVTWALATAGVVSTLTFSLLMALAAMTSGNSALVGAGAVATVTALALAAGYVVVIKMPALSERIGFRLESIVSRIGSNAGAGIRGFVENLTSYRPRPGSFVVAGGAGFLNWALDVAALGFSIQAVGGHVPLAVLVVVWAGAGAASSLSFTPSGLGVVEPLLVAGLVAGGIHHTSALAATALYRLVSLFLVAAACWIVQLSLTRRTTGRVPGPAVEAGLLALVPATTRQASAKAPPREPAGRAPAQAA